MSDIDHRKIDRLRRGKADVANHVIDEFVAQRISRREFVRWGTVVGLSVPVLGAIVAACGSSPSPHRATAGRGKAGATIRVGTLTPTGEINPLTVPDRGGEQMLGQTGEFLCVVNQKLELVPVLATGWRPNSTATVWTFSIRRGVKFSDGKPLTADDVIYTYKIQTNPKSASNALSNFAGVLIPDGVRKVDDYTVAFHLEAPNGSFPYLCSSDNYNMIILPDRYDPSKWQRSFIGTGPFVMKSYTPNVGARFVRNSRYWGKEALPAATEWTFYDAEAPMSLALQGGDIDYMQEFTVAASPELLNGGYRVVDLKSAEHLELSMRNDLRPFNDPRVREAVALTLDRPAILAALLKNRGSIGNDSPFAPIFSATSHAVPQRKKNLMKAKALLASAGYPHGFATNLVTQNTEGAPQFAQLVKESAAAVGVDISLTVEATTKYYGAAVFGKSDWLDGIMSLVHYAARSIPNVYLTAPLQSINIKTGQGSWNAARFRNTTYDRLSQEYVASVDLTAQRRLAGEIERLLLDETPIVYAYFVDFLSAARRDVFGIYPVQNGQIFLANATKG
jgi:peptide/nickel transport system substrate-binding protein